MSLKELVQANMLGYGVAIVLAIGGTIFVAGAAYLALLRVMPPELAALITGLALLAAAAAVAWWTRRRARQSELAEPDAIEQVLQEYADSLLSAGIRQHPKGATLSTLVLGFVSAWLRSAPSERCKRADRGRDRSRPR